MVTVKALKLGGVGGRGCRPSLCARWPQFWAPAAIPRPLEVAGQAGRVSDRPGMPAGARSGHFSPLADRNELPVCPTARGAGMSAPAWPHNSLGHREWPWRAIGAIGRGVVVIDPAALFRSLD